MVNLRGVKKVYAVDRDARRLAVAKSFAMNLIDMSLHEDPAEHILAIEPHSLDRGIVNLKSVREESSCKD